MKKVLNSRSLRSVSVQIQRVSTSIHTRNTNVVTVRINDSLIGLEVSKADWRSFCGWGERVMGVP